MTQTTPTDTRAAAEHPLDPVQSEEDSGLPAWTSADRPIEDTDVVLRYVYGIHHITRPEDWPVMPVDTVSFRLKPVGFFDRNPALDLAPADGSCHGPASSGPPDQPM